MLKLFGRARAQYLTLRRRIADIERLQRLHAESEKMLLGRLLSDRIKRIPEVSSFKDVEFQVFSQFGDDGIIQWLVHNVEVEIEVFVEFGVEDYRESNSRFLLMNDNWTGYVLDGSAENIRSIVKSEYYWKYDLTAAEAFVTKDNINGILEELGLGGDVGLLHIDIDGNDYWVWQAIDVISPAIVILEYNSVFGIDRSITVPYVADFDRTSAHYSNLFFGASLSALSDLSNEKGYAFVGCNSAGNNAYFVRRDKLNDVVRERPVREGYVYSKFRESRDEDFNLNFLSADDRLSQIKGMTVVNTKTGGYELL